jgi:diguanylate cyclase
MNSKRRGHSSPTHGRKGWLLDWVIGSLAADLPEVRSALLLTLREHLHVTVLTTLWVVTSSLALWWCTGSLWGLAFAAAELMLFPLRVLHSQQISSRGGRPRPRYDRVIACLAVWMSLIALLSYACASQGDVRLVLLGTILACGSCGYVASRWAALPRFALIMIAALWGALGLGLAVSPLPGAEAIAWLTPAAALGFTVLLRLNHAIISDALRVQRENRSLSMHDPLTALPNRLLLRERLAQLCREVQEPKPASAFAVLCLDLDGFKPVNDRHGHHGGDWLLKLVANRLRGAVRAHDLVCRSSGDEFVVLLPDADADSAVEVARRILVAFSEPFDIGSTASVGIGVSIGIALAPEHGTSPDRLLGAADEALHAVKRSGRSAWRVYAAELAASSRPSPLRLVSNQGASSRSEGSSAEQVR